MNINIKKTIENMKKQNEIFIKNLGFTNDELVKASILNKAYRTYINSSNKEEMKMFYMLLEAVGIEKWKDLCYLQQNKDLISLLEEAEEFNGTVKHEYDTDNLFDRYIIEYDNEKIVFDMDTSNIYEIGGNENVW